MDKDTTLDEHKQPGMEKLMNAIMEEFTQIRRRQHACRIQYGKKEKKVQREKTAKRLLESVDTFE